MRYDEALNNEKRQLLTSAKKKKKKISDFFFKKSFNKEWNERTKQVNKECGQDRQPQFLKESRKQKLRNKNTQTHREIEGKGKIRTERKICNSCLST